MNEKLLQQVADVISRNSMTRYDDGEGSYLWRPAYAMEIAIALHEANLLADVEEKKE